MAPAESQFPYCNNKCVPAKSSGNMDKAQAFNLKDKHTITRNDRAIISQRLPPSNEKTGVPNCRSIKIMAKIGKNVKAAYTIVYMKAVFFPLNAVIRPKSGNIAAASKI